MKCVKCVIKLLLQRHCSVVKKCSSRDVGTGGTCPQDFSINKEAPFSCLEHAPFFLRKNVPSKCLAPPSLRCFLRPCSRSFRNFACLVNYSVNKTWSGHARKVVKLSWHLIYTIKWKNELLNASLIRSNSSDAYIFLGPPGTSRGSFHQVGHEIFTMVRFVYDVDLDCSQILATWEEGKEI